MATPINSSDINNATAAAEALNRALESTVQLFIRVNQQGGALKNIERSIGRINQRFSSTESLLRRLETRLGSFSTKMDAIVRASADFRDNMNSVRIPPIPPVPPVPPPPPGGGGGGGNPPGGGPARMNRWQAAPKSLMPIIGQVSAFAGQLVVATGALSINEALKEKQLKDMLVNQTGSEAAGMEVYNNASANALKLGIDKGEAVKVALSKQSSAQNTDQLNRMTSMATQMGALSGGGATSAQAAKAIEVAMTGDFKGLIDQFNITKEQIESAGLSGFVKAKDMDGFLGAMDQILEKSNLGKSALDSMLSSPLNQLNVLNGQLKSGFASAGAGAVAVLQPVFAKLIEAFESGKFQPFFDMLHVGLTLAAHLFDRLVDGAIWLFSTIGQYWPVIGGILTALVAVLLPSIIMGLWAMVAPILAQAVAWLAAYWPILLIVAVIGLLLALFMNFGLTAENIIGSIMGYFNMLYTSIMNFIALIWNQFISFGEFLANLFIDPIYAIQKLFYDVFKNIFDFIVNFINSMISNIDRFLDLLGIDKKINIDLNSDFMEVLKPKASDKKVLDLSSLKMEQKNTSDAYKEGYEFGGSLVRNATGAIEGFKGKLDGAFPAPKTTPPIAPTGTIPNIDRIGEVGSINETVDISSEDLKTMRELAEMKNIQNFVSLQPSVSVQTGDINNGHDIDTIIGRIERTLNEQIATSAEGMYA